MRVAVSDQNLTDASLRQVVLPPRAELEELPNLLPGAAVTNIWKQTHLIHKRTSSTHKDRLPVTGQSDKYLYENAVFHLPQYWNSIMYLTFSSFTLDFVMFSLVLAFLIFILMLIIVGREI